ncbi:tripartite tricarboxylate transporter TctB family protein [Geminicoccus roseus]|uniref:tripartite tricarboxylate transporter TctB family protein n=1 Tax=Geminicoccus roseus TaxID=404900 RepID=UPI0004858466|nr:tripartite tricarboxylate transporter TctB family protein [Geminicoccus roseus]
MSPRERLAAASPELVAGLVTLVIGGLFIAEARGLPPPFFEPIGSAAVPRATAWIVVALSIAMMAKAVLIGTSRKIHFETRADVWRTIAFAALVIAYVVGLALTRIGFASLTIAFLTIAIPLLGGFSRRMFLQALALGVVLGFALQYLFTRVLVTDLP